MASYTRQRRCHRLCVPDRPGKVPAKERACPCFAAIVHFFCLGPASPSRAYSSSRSRIFHAVPKSSGRNSSNASRRPASEVDTPDSPTMMFCERRRSVRVGVLDLRLRRDAHSSMRRSSEVESSNSCTVEIISYSLLSRPNTGDKLRSSIMLRLRLLHPLVGPPAPLPQVLLEPM